MPSSLEESLQQGTWSAKILQKEIRGWKALTWKRMH